jgi:hypothetical protein
MSNLKFDENRKYGVIILTAQKDHSDIDGNSPKQGCSILYNSISSFINKHRNEIQFIVTTFTVNESNNCKFNVNWRFEDTGLHPSPGDILRKDTLSSTGYSVNFKPVRFRFASGLDPSFSALTLEKKSFVNHSVGCALDPIVATQCAKFRYLHLYNEKIPSLVEKDLKTNSGEITDWVVMGNAYSINAQRIMISVLSMLKKCYPKVKCWGLNDLCKGITPNNSLKNLLTWTNSYDLTNETYNIRGLPVHIQPSTVSTFQPLSAVIKLENDDITNAVKNQWRNLLCSLQHSISLFKENNTSYKYVGKHGNELMYCNGHNENMGEFISIDMFNKVKNGDKDVDPLDREYYIKELRPFRRSFVNLGYGVPPIVNPYGTNLMNGRGSLPFFGPNHHFVTLHVINVNQDSTEYHFEYHTEIYPHMINSELYPNKSELDSKMIIYEGYLPHEDNTRHSWRECIVVAVDVTNPTTHLNGNEKFTPIENEWLSSFKLMNEKLVEGCALANPCMKMISTLTLETLKKIFNPDIINFLENGLHLNDGESLYNWILYAPKNAEEIVNEWSINSLSLLIDALHNIKSTKKYNEDVAYVFRAFRVPFNSSESIEEEFIKKANALYPKFEAKSFSDIDKLKKFFISNSIDMVLLDVKIDKLVDILRNLNLGRQNENLNGSNLPIFNPKYDHWNSLIFNEESKDSVMNKLSKLDIIDSRKKVKTLLLSNMSIWLVIVRKLMGNMTNATLQTWILHSLWLSEKIERSTIQEPFIHTKIYQRFYI